jgi:deoxyribodipyrimidine photo-lyase
MDKKTEVAIFWFRRDLRLDDNAGFYHALKGEHPVLPVFIFDKEILDKLEDKDDARVTFIYETIKGLDKALEQHGSSLLVLHDTPEKAWETLLKNYALAAVYTNHDYEPGAKKRDAAVEKLLKSQDISFNTYKDQVIFEKDEVVKDDGKPYTVYTPYSRKWYQNLKPFFLKAYPNKKYFNNLLKTDGFKNPYLKQLVF